MRYHALKSLLLLVCLFSFWDSDSLIAQEKQEITVEWIYSDERNKVTAVPRFVWLKDNTAIFYDLRKPKAKRTFERYDPASGKRTPIIDLKKTLASLKPVRG